MRELSISLFRDVMETVVGNDKKRMKKKVQRGLIPLFFHTCDETDSVAKVEISKLATDTGKGVLNPRHQRQELLARGLWERVSSWGLTDRVAEGRAGLPAVPALLPPLLSSSPSASCCRGRRGGGIHSQPRSLHSAFLLRLSLRKGPCRTSVSRGREAGIDISSTCPTCSGRAQQQPVARGVNTRVPTGFPAVPAGVGGQGFQPRSLSPRAVPRTPPDVWARACPSFPRAGSPQEQSQEEGDASSPSPDRGAISQLLLLSRSLGKPSSPPQSSSSGRSSNTWCRHSRHGGLESAW